MIHRFKTIESTNTYAKELAAHGAPHGTVVVAEQQTGGRGRLGRSFFSPAGTGLYLSMILRPQHSPQELMHLTCAAAVAACDAVESATDLRPGIKWTNDLVHQGRKLGGILTELGFSGEELDYAIVGIGINCNQSQTDFPADLQTMATSLSTVTGKPVDVSKLEDTLINSLVHTFDKLVDQRNQIMNRYRTDCVTIGQDICVINGKNVRHAKALSVEDDGSLRILLPDGKEELVSTGEVSIRGMYGYL